MTPSARHRRIATWIGLGLIGVACAGEALPEGENTLPPLNEILLPINGTRLFVHREGSGEPAIVVHGGPVLDQTYLQPHLAPLTDQLELVYYDQRLSGRSHGVVDSASVRLDTFVDDVETLRRTLDLGSVHLIAHSWGGLIAMKYAIRHPENLRSLILLDALPPSAALWQEEQAAEAARLTAADTAGGGALRATEAFRNREPEAVEAVLIHSFRRQFQDPELASALDFYVPSDYGERSRQFAFMAPDLMAFDLREDLQRVETPTLVLYGTEEPGDQIGGEAIAAALPNAIRTSVPEAGHFPFIEQPTAFLEAVRSFLAGIP